MSSEIESISDDDDERRNRGSNDGEILSDTPPETDIIEGESNNPQELDENKKDSEDEAKKKVVKPKRIIKNPQPKFNENTLKTEKGLPAIKDHFKNLKLKGKGYEERDLNAIMKSYEYWCHRLYPKFTFNDSIARLEVLGNKKITRTYITKIRLGMECSVEEEKNLASDEEIPTTGFVEPFDDRFNQLISTSVHEPEPELTEEQLEKIRQNKLRAEALRRERLLKINQSNGVTDQNISINLTQNSLNNEQTEMEVDENQEMDLDNMLDLINEEPGTSTDVDSQKINNDKVSNSIRSARFESLFYNNSDGENEDIVNSQNAPIINDNNKLDNDNGKESDQKRKIARGQKKYTKRPEKNNSSDSSSDDSETTANKRIKKRPVATDSDKESLSINSSDDSNDTTLKPKDSDEEVANRSPKNKNIGTTIYKDQEKNGRVIESDEENNADKINTAKEKRRNILDSDDSNDGGKSEEVVKLKANKSRFSKKKKNVIMSDEDD